jgi:hypothetical protein
MREGDEWKTTFVGPWVWKQAKIKEEKGECELAEDTVTVIGSK